MYCELNAYVRSCDSCQRNKTSNQKPIGLLKPLEIPTERFEQVSMDFIPTLPVTKENHDAVMVIVDKLAKLMFISTCNTQKMVVTLVPLPNGNKGKGVRLYRGVGRKVVST
jgi:hypothetical protein